MTTRRVSDIIVGRLPVYLRALQRMSQNGMMYTSSQEMGKYLGISAAQIRKDISQFGQFGKQGTGYDIATLIKRLENILKVNRIWDVAIIGAGDMGHALARYKGFEERGFKVAMIFDSDRSKIGQKAGEFTVEDSAKLADRIRAAGIKIAMMTVPAAAAQAVADQLVDAGIKAILNYTPAMLSVPATVHVQHIDPARHLQRMTYYLS